METQYISLNMTPTGVNPCFHISQYDVGRMLGFIVHSGGATVDLDTYTCTVEATRSDGTAITSAVATTDNIGTFEVTPTMSNKTDKYRCQLVIVDANSKRIASLPFDMEVTKAAMDENSEAIEEDASLYQQYTEAVQGAIAEANADIQAEENARIAAVNAEATARQNADAALQNNIDAEATARQSADNTLQGNINSEASTRASADSNLQSQINQIIAPSGEAPSAAEVQNARIGTDGTVYNTLGNAIRGQVGELDAQLKDGNVANLLTLNAGSTATSYNVKFTVNDDKSVTVSGTATGDALFNLYNSQTGFIGDVVPGDELYIDISGTNVLGIVAIYEGTSARDIVESKTPVRVRIPLSATGMIVRVGVGTGITVNETVNISIYHGYTNEGLKENINNLESTFKDVKTNVWHKGLLTAAGVINTASRGIYSDIISGCNSIRVNFDHIAYVFLYRSGYYIGKIAADGSLNRVSGDWKAFTGGVDVGALLTQYKADSARITVTPQNSATITEENANDYGNVNCEITADVYIRTSNEKSEALEDAKALPYVLGNPLYPYYKGFQFCSYDASGTNVNYGSPTYVRCTAICQFDKPVYISINHPDYTLGIYWKENGTLYNKTLSPTWEVPVGVPVAIVIRKKETDTQQSMQGETPWKYMFVRGLDDKPRDFFLSEIEDTIKKVQDANTEPSLCFTLSTDHHYMTTINWLTDYDSISDMTANMKAVGEAINFDFNVSLGDIADFKPPYSDAVAARFGILDRSAANLDSVFAHWRDYAMTRLKNVNPNFIYACGNHDDNRYLRVDAGTSGYDYTPDEMYSYYMSNAYKTLSGANPNNLLEYYFDIDRLGIRVIVLDSNYYNDTGWDYGFSDSTASWLGGVLASSSGKQVLILSHMSPVASHNGDNYAYHNFDAVANVIQTWKTGGGDLIALMYGHSHCDWSATSPWLDITFCCQKIHQLSSSEPFANMPGSVAPARTFGTATEDCWNVVIIKPKSRKINIIRFGAGVDREFTY